MERTVNIDEYAERRLSVPGTNMVFTPSEKKIG
jgi:hypothetical protein